MKYLYEKVFEYDIGIYFEVNGYGIILFLDKILFWLEVRKNEFLFILKGDMKCNLFYYYFFMNLLINKFN